ncbi:transaldolase family protein [Cohnella abietis]|uniref:Putative transaldolase n=1 Tax=Cohnella abietis TaxID=2507935 RepID=A0A3T1D669_9BACL|nr:transaldolase family protein [Cohnella abietis]BBI33572.1 putative transaldolase [Cohnella abietis]
MEFYLDTANIEEIKEAGNLGFLDGVTTNPSILAKEGENPESRIKEIANYVPGKIWCQVTAETADEMYEQARTMNSWVKHAVIKLPMTPNGLSAAARLVQQGIEVNMTLVYSLPQVLLAAKAGVTYISPYVGRIDDLGWDGQRFIQEALDTLQKLGSTTKVIAASIRSPQVVVDLAVSGVHAVTMQYGVLQAMFRSPMTDIGLASFQADWNGLQAKLNG